MVHSWGVSLQKSGKEDCAIHWPLCFIRKYKNEMLGLSPKRKTTMVTLELGRRCVTGEGIFKFRTQYGREIVTEMTQVISSSMNRKMTVESVLSSSKSSTGHLPFSSNTNSYRGPWSQENDTGWWVGGAVSPPDRPASLYSTGSESRHEHSRSSSESTHLHRGVLRSGSTKLPAMHESTSSVTSSASSSGESAEYIMASFSEKSQRLQFDTRNVLRASRSTNDIAAYLSTPIGALSREEAQRQRIARAEAEGYLEVLPDYYDGEKASEERSNIYHNMDFTNNDKTITDTKMAAEVVDSATTRGLVPFTSDGGASSVTTRASPNPSRKKPPAPLPRPEHTMANEVGGGGGGGSFFRRPLNHVLSPPTAKLDFSSRSPEHPPSSPPSVPTSPLGRAPLSPLARGPPKETPDPQYECVLIGPLHPTSPTRKPPILPKPEHVMSAKESKNEQRGGGASVMCPRLEPTMA